jgi:hypothetical protein
MYEIYDKYIIRNKNSGKIVQSTRYQVRSTKKRETRNKRLDSLRLGRRFVSKKDSVFLCVLAPLREEKKKE